MNNLTPTQLDMIADACEFYFLYLAQKASDRRDPEADCLADAADAFGDLADIARNASEVH